MKWVSDNEIAEHETSGAWGNDPALWSLDGLLRTNVIKKPTALALCDAPDKQEWTSTVVQNLTWQELDERVNALAHFLTILGLPDRSVIALYQANTVETVISLLAIWRAGFIAAPMPLFWREHDLEWAVNAVRARAIISTAHLEDDELALRCRAVASKAYSIRYVFSFGGALPDGVMDLEKVINNDLEFGLASKHEFQPQDPHAVTTLHFADNQSSDEPIFISRSSCQWINATAITSSQTEAPILCPYIAGGTNALTLALLPCLQNVSTLHLHHYRSVKRLKTHALALNQPFIFLVPCDKVKEQTEAFNDSDITLSNLNIIWPAKQQTPEIPFTHSAPIRDVITYGNTVVLAQERETGQEVPTPLAMAYSTQDGKTALEMHLIFMRKEKTLAIKGPAAPTLRMTLESEGAKACTFPLEWTPSIFRGTDNTSEAKNNTWCTLSGLTFKYAELDKLFVHLPNSSEAATFQPVGSNTLALAYVGDEVTLDDVARYMKHLKHSPLLIPEALIAVTTLPKTASGILDRSKIAAMMDEAEQLPVAVEQPNLPDIADLNKQIEAMQESYKQVATGH